MANAQTRDAATLRRYTKKFPVMAAENAEMMMFWKERWTEARYNRARTLVDATQDK